MTKENLQAARAAALEAREAAKAGNAKLDAPMIEEARTALAKALDDIDAVREATSQLISETTNDGIPIGIHVQTLITAAGNVKNILVTLAADAAAKIKAG